MATTPQFFALSEVPDARYLPFRDLVAHPRRAMWNAMAHVLRFVGDLTAGAARLCLRYVFDPDASETGPQGRLNALVGMWAPSASVAEAIASLLLHGPMSRYFRLMPVDPPALPAGLGACCHILRKWGTVAPLVSDEFNAAVPEGYFTCRAFEPNEENDFLAVDRVLDGFLEPVVIDVGIEPIDVEESRRAHTQYISRLQKILRIWDTREDVMMDEDPLAARAGARLDHHVLKPLHRPDPTAQDVQRLQQPLQEVLQEPCVRFHAVAMACTEASAHLVASTMADSGFADGGYSLCTHGDGAGMDHVRGALEAVALVDLVGLDALGEAVAAAGPPCMAELLHTASVHELVGLFRLPVVGCGSPFCMRTNTDPPVVTTSELIALGHDASAEERGEHLKRGVALKGMVQSLFLAGMPGMGKTTVEMHVAIQFCARGVPMLVIECAKKEMRALKRHVEHSDKAVRRLARGLELYTPGDETLSPMRCALLERVPGMSVSEAVDSLARCFEAAMPMTGPVSPILVEALEETYETAEHDGRLPSIEDLMQTAREVVRRKGYSAETRADIEAAIDTRLGRLTRGTVGDVFRCTRSWPSVERLFRSMTVIELDGADTYCSSLLTLHLLTQLRAALRSMPAPDRVPRLMIFICEAHQILRKSDGAAPSEGNPDPRSYVVEAVCQMLAELRALGVGVVISDQTPSVLAPEIIKLTGAKLAFRLVDVADRDAVGAAMLFEQSEYENIARLSEGEAYFFTKGYYRPQLIRTVNIHETV